MFNCVLTQHVLQIFILTTAIQFNSLVDSKINDRDSEEVEITYHSHIRSERSLPVCELNTACNVVHKRFWFKIKVERLCRCQNSIQCSQQWSSTPDNYTMDLSNRSQLKFCNNINDMKKCTKDEPALIQRYEAIKAPRSRSGSKNFQTKTTAQCNCPSRRYWKINSTDPYSDSLTRVYHCTEVHHCELDQFCGHVRADTYATYYQCSCPTGSLCLLMDRNLDNVTELFYTGLAYRAHCATFPDNLTNNKLNKENS